MRLIAMLFLLFVLMPILELILLFKFAAMTSALLTLMIVIFTGLLGATLAKVQGITAFNRIRTALARGQLPGQEVIEGVLILLAAAVLVTPGFITDIVGFTLLIPVTRRPIARLLIRHFQSRITLHTPGFKSRPTPERADDGKIETIEATRIDDDEDDQPVSR